MAIAQSKITAQGQISVPVDVRKILGVGPGSVLDWEERNGEVVVKRAKKYTSLDLHKAAFPDGPPKPVSIEDMDESIRRYVRARKAKWDAGS